MFFNSLPSTNKYCELLDLNSVEEFFFVWTHTQTAGVGQQGNQWHGEPGKNIAMSLVLHPTFVTAARQFMLTQTISLAVAEYVRERLSDKEEVKIKWPNDIYVGLRKICGILCTSTIKGSSIGSTVCGIGLNVNQINFPDNIPNPVSLSEITKHGYNLEEEVATLIENIKKWYSKLLNGGGDEIERQYRRQMLYLQEERKYLLHGDTITASIQGTDPYGHLVLRQSESNKEITCGIKEIQFVL